jgi:hypothetical protein
VNTADNIYDFWTNAGDKDCVLSDAVSVFIFRHRTWRFFCWGALSFSGFNNSFLAAAYNPIRSGLFTPTRHMPPLHKQKKSGLLVAVYDPLWYILRRIC